MSQIAKTPKRLRIALVWASMALAFIVAGCATTASYRPEIDTMKGALAEAKVAGAETLAPEEYARAEACLDRLTHEATEFRPFADPNTGKYVRDCRPALQALKNKMAAAPPVPVPVVPPVPPVPAVDQGIYPTMGTLEEALSALPPVAVAPPAPEVPPAPVAAPSPPPVAPPVPAPVTPPPPVAPPLPVVAKEPERVKRPPIEDVYFDYDQSLIRPDAKKSLDINVPWLNANPKATIIIEGHCDERGTREYNLALGERRAKAALDYLVTSGIDPSRIKTISYGKERPFAVGHDEEAWKWNRRGHFVLP